jgi:hypothetical protein
MKLYGIRPRDTRSDDTASTSRKVLSIKLRGDATMFNLTRNRCLKFAAAGAFFVLTAATPARAEQLPQNLGPVGPHVPILTDVGAKRVLAWYEPDSDGCAVTAVAWNRSDIDGTSTVGIRIRLEPGEIVHIDSSYDIKPLDLQCADDAASLSIADNGELVAFGWQDTNPPVRQEANPSMKASVSGF